MHYLKRSLNLLLGLFIFAAGVYCSIQANVGMSPWAAFSIGFSNLLGISYGNVFVITGVVIILIDVALKEKIGVGTVLNALLVGKMNDAMNYFNLVPMAQNFWWGMGLIFISLVLISVGSYFYIGAAMGAGPRDSLMVALGKRLKRLTIGTVRILIEGGALLVGWLLGAKVGLGTVVYVFGLGVVLDTTFHLLRFNVKAIKQESLLDTLNNIRRKPASPPAGE